MNIFFRHKNSNNLNTFSSNNSSSSSNNNINKKNNNNVIQNQSVEKKFNLNDNNNKQHQMDTSSDKLVRKTSSKKEINQKKNENDDNLDENDLKKTKFKKRDNKHDDDDDDDEKNFKNSNLKNESLKLTQNESNVNNNNNNNTNNDNLISNEPRDDKANLLVNIETLNLDPSKLHMSRRSSKQSNSISRNFIRRLLSCGGSCTGNRSTSNSIVLKSNTTNLNNSNKYKNNSASKEFGLFMSKSIVNETRKPFESSLSFNKLHENLTQLNESLHQYKSDTNLNSTKEDHHETIENSYEYASYESIIDKFVHSTKLYNNENYNLSSKRIIDSPNYDVKNNKDNKKQENSNQSDMLNKNSTAQNLKLVLPALKVNDHYLDSPNVNGKKEFHPSNTDESLSVEEFEDDEEEIIELDEEEEEDEEVDDDDEYDQECCDEVHNDAFEYDANYHLHLDSDNNIELDANITSEYDDNGFEKNNKKIHQITNSNKKLDKKLPSKSTSKQVEENQPKPHFKLVIDDSNLKVCNRNTNRTSCNLGCDTSLSFGSTRTPSRRSNDLIDSSNECFDSFAQTTNFIKSSQSNFSIKNNFETELNDECVNSADNGANLFVPLLKHRKQKAQNGSARNLNLLNSEILQSSSKSSSIGPFSKSPSPLFSGNDSTVAPITTETDTTKQIKLNQHQNEPKLEEKDEINEISKVKNWLIETNHHHHNHLHKENFDSNLIETKSKSENTDSAIDVNSSCSNSNASKSSSNKLARIRWESFNKYYQTNFQQQQQTNDNTQNYQIAAMSLEQLMSLRKLALLQFSKLLERQHSTMTRLFSKNKDIVEFRRVYDSIDSLRMDSATSSSSKAKTNVSNGDANLINNNENYESLIIENKKIHHQLGEPNERKRNSKANSFKTNIAEMSISEKRDEKSVIKLNESSSQSNKVIEKVVTINTKSFSSTPSTVFGTSLTAIMQHTGQPLPHKILEAMKYLRKIAQNEIGVFRKNGVKTRINKLKESINRNESIDYQSSEYTPFDIADTIKLYFRELPECLITNKLSDILLSNYDKIRPEERKVILQQVMLLIPDENRLVLQTLLLFLNEIAKFYKINQMTRSNLAVCFSPVIFRFNLEKKSKLKQTIPSTVVVTPPTPIVYTNSIKLNTSNSNLENSIDEDKIVNTNSTSSNGLSDKQVVQSTSQPELCEKKNNESNQIKSSAKIDKFNNDNTILLTTTATTPLFSISESTLATTPTTTIMTASPSKQNPTSTTPQSMKLNYKRKYSEKINRAASSIVNFGAELNKSNKFTLNESSKGSLENMNKVIQLCVSDMIKYSVELFNVPVENFEKFKLTFSNSDPPNLDYYYDTTIKSLKKADFFVNNIKMDKNNWYYLDKFEDVSIYFCKNESSNETRQDDTSIMLPELTTNSSPSTNTSPMPVNDTIAHSSLTVQTSGSANESQQIYLNTSLPHSISSTIVTSTSFLTLMPQKFETFSDKLKLWKCCTLIKQKNVTLDKIVERIKHERHLWDDDFVEGNVIENLDDDTEIHRYTISFMPPHSPKEFLEIRHKSKQNLTNIDTIILTSTSIKHKDSLSSSSSYIRSNMMVSKYVIEKLIATDITTTFKITHYVKLDYKGFTLEFYNKAFGYSMARLLYNLKMSFKSL